MVKYTGPRVKIIRRLGILPGLTRKIYKIRKKTPGEAGEDIRKLHSKRSTLKTDYKNCLLEKQKLRFNYGITEKQLYTYYNTAKKSKYLTGTILLELLESRLDTVVFRLGYTQTISSARQLINHKHVLINNKIISIPSFICKPNDIISISVNKKLKELITNSVLAKQLRQELILKKMKQVNLAKSRLTGYFFTGNHLKLNKNSLNGIFLFPPKQKDFLLKIDVTKILQYFK